MGWKFAVKEETGAVIDHWEIERINMDVQAGSLEISYQGWVSQAEKLAGSKPVSSRSVVINQDLSVANALNFIKLCESLVKSVKFPDAISYLNDILVPVSNSGSWKVTNFNYDDLSKLVQIFYSGHKTVQDQTNGAPVLNDVCEYSYDECPDLFNSLISYAKARVRSEEMFTNT